MNADIATKARQFRRLHVVGDIFLMPNAWDAGSAILLAAAGFAAIGTTSGGVNWSRGRRDYVYEISRDPMLTAYKEIAEAVDLPVHGDLENGYGDSPEDVAATISRSVRCGLVGGSIEDYTADPAKPLYDRSLAVERVRAARLAADQTGLCYTLTARCEVYSLPDHPDPFGEAVTRANLYREAGADCIFVPGPNDLNTIGALVREIDAPFNQVIGLGNAALTVAMLADVGVRRISTGGSLARACFGLLRRSAQEMMAAGTFGYTTGAISDPDTNALFGKPRASHGGPPSEELRAG